MWLVRVEGTLSVQDLVCDSSRGVSVEVVLLVVGVACGFDVGW